MEIELKPCPFCGGNNIAYVAGDRCTYTTCDDCMAEGPFAAGEEQEEAAAKLWNTRHTEDMEGA